MLENMHKHSVDIVLNTIYATGVNRNWTWFSNWSLCLPTMEAAPNIPLLQFCLNCISHSSTVSKHHQILRIPPLLIQREKDLPASMKTGAGKGVGKREGKQRGTAADKRYSTLQNSPTILYMPNSRESPPTCWFSQLKAAGAAADHLPLFSCANMQKAMQNICDFSKVERVIKNQWWVKRGKEASMMKLSRQEIKRKENSKEKGGWNEKCWGGNECMAWVKASAVQKGISSPEGLLKWLQELMVPW